MTPRASRSALGVVAFAAICGAVGGGIAAQGAARERAEDAPPGWTRQERNAAYMNPATLGELRPESGAWALSAYTSLHAPRAATALSFTARLGVDGELWVLPSAHGNGELDGAALVLATGRPPRAERLQANAAPVALPCRGALPVPTAAPYTVTATATAAGWQFASLGETLACDLGPPAPGAPAFASGLHRVALDALSVDGAAMPRPSDALPVALASLAGALGLAILAGVQLAVGVSPALVGFGALPLLFAPLLAQLNLGGLHEALRIPSLRVFLVPAGVPLALSAAITLLATTSRVGARTPGLRPLAVVAPALIVAGVSGGDPRWLPAALGVAAGVGVGVWAAFRLLRHPTGASPGAPPSTAAALSPAVAVALAGAGGALAAALLDGQPRARIWATLAAAALGLLVQLAAHAGRLRAYNPASLAVAAFFLCACELGLRHTSVSPYWDATNPVQGAGDISTLVDQLDALHRAEHERYPAAGYPVRPPPRVRPIRVVALGGSSTAGAWQNADIAEFYPALVEARLGPEVEVVNQGAGGWNTLHIALYATSKLAELAPEIVTVYTGVNEVVELPVPYRDLLDAWRAGTLRGGPTLLADIRLYQGLRNIVRSLRASVVAVPPEDTRANLSEVIAAARRTGARTLLLSEAVQPRPEAFARYTEVMRDLADGQADVAFLDTAEAMRSSGRSAFLDQNHLSAAGHARIAELVADALVSLHWVPDPVEAPEPVDVTAASGPR